MFTQDYLMRMFMQLAAAMKESLLRARGMAAMLQLSQPDPQLMEYVSRSLLLSSQYLREAGDASASALRQEQAYAVARAFDVELGEGGISQNELDELFARSGLDAETLGV